MKEYKSIEEANEALQKYQEAHNKSDCPKPENEPEFLEPFTYLLRKFDIEKDGSFQFDGDGAYSGKQIVIAFSYQFWRGDAYGIEIAYSQNKCTIYTSNHNGYWSPPYAELSGTKYADIRNLIFAQIRKCVGI